MKKSKDQFVDGFTWVLCGNFLLWFVLLFVAGFAMNKISWFGNWIERLAAKLRELGVNPDEI